MELYIQLKWDGEIMTWSKAVRDQLAEKVVLITGASSGIGRATADAFAAAGATPVLAARRESLLAAATTEVGAVAPEASWVAMDVADLLQVRRAIEAVIERHGRIDILFNNAGHAVTGAVTARHFERGLESMFRVDVMGTVHTTRAVLPSMLERGSGHILNMSSVVGRKAFPGFGGYSSMMHALTGFSAALRQELRGTGVGVSTIHPALTQTELFSEVPSSEMPRTFRNMSPITPEEVAVAAVRGVARGRARIVVPSQPKVLMLLDAVSPNLGDAMVRLLERPWFARAIGSFRGEHYRGLARQEG